MIKGIKNGRSVLAGTCHDEGEHFMMMMLLDDDKVIIEQDYFFYYYLYSYLMPTKSLSC